MIWDTIKSEWKQKVTVMRNKCLQVSSCGEFKNCTLQILGLNFLGKSDDDNAQIPEHNLQKQN
jgi:hypothetical protein